MKAILDDIRRRYAGGDVPSAEPAIERIGHALDNPVFHIYSAAYAKVSWWLPSGIQAGMSVECVYFCKSVAVTEEGDAPIVYTMGLSVPMAQIADLKDAVELIGRAKRPSEQWLHVYEGYNATGSDVPWDTISIRGCKYINAWTNGTDVTAHIEASEMHVKTKEEING